MKEPNQLGRVQFYADENVDQALIKSLRHFDKVNIVAAVDLGFSGRDDQFHFQEAARRKRFLLTCDFDFLNHRLFPFHSMQGVVILDPPKGYPSLGYMNWWLNEHIIPSGREIYGTKIVVHARSIEIHCIDETGKIARQRLPDGTG